LAQDILAQAPDFARSVTNAVVCILS